MSDRLTGMDLRRLRHQVFPCITTRELGPLVGLSHAVLVAIEGGQVEISQEKAEEIAEVIQRLASERLEAGRATVRKHQHWKLERRGGW